MINRNLCPGFMMEMLVFAVILASSVPAESGGSPGSIGVGAAGAFSGGFLIEDNGAVMARSTGMHWYMNADNPSCGSLNWDDRLRLLLTWPTASSPVCSTTPDQNSAAWAVPNRVQLRSLINRAFYDPPITNSAGTGQWTPGDPFIAVPVGWVWTSDTDASNPNNAWAVHFASGAEMPLPKSTTLAATVFVSVQPSVPVFKLDLSIGGTGSGFVSVNPPGQVCSSSCYQWSISGVITDFACGGSNMSICEGMTGDQDCSDGSVTMSGARSCISTMTACQSLADVRGSQFSDFAAALSAIQPGDIMKLAGTSIPGQVALDTNDPLNIGVTLSGGFNCSFGGQSFSRTYIEGPVTINGTSGPIGLDGITIGGFSYYFY